MEEVFSDSSRHYKKLYSVVRLEYCNHMVYKRSFLERRRRGKGPDIGKNTISKEPVAADPLADRSDGGPSSMETPHLSCLSGLDPIDGTCFGTVSDAGPGTSSSGGTASRGMVCGDGGKVLLSCRSKERVVYVPEGVETVSAGAFRDSMAEEVHLPSTAGRIEDGVLSGSMVSAVHVHPSNPVYTDAEGVLYGNGGRELVAFPPGRCAPEYRVPEGTVSVHRHAFDGSGIEMLHLNRDLELCLDDFLSSGWMSLSFPEGFSGDVVGCYVDADGNILGADMLGDRRFMQMFDDNGEAYCYMESDEV